MIKAYYQYSPILAEKVVQVFEEHGETIFEVVALTYKIYGAVYGEPLALQLLEIYLQTDPAITAAVVEFMITSDPAVLIEALPMFEAMDVELMTTVVLAADLMGAERVVHIASVGSRYGSQAVREVEELHRSYGPVTANTALYAAEYVGPWTTPVIETAASVVPGSNARNQGQEQRFTRPAVYIVCSLLILFGLIFLVSGYRFYKGFLCSMFLLAVSIFATNIVAPSENSTIIGFLLAVIAGLLAWTFPRIANALFGGMVALGIAIVFDLTTPVIIAFASVIGIILFAVLRKHALVIASGCIGACFAITGIRMAIALFDSSSESLPVNYEHLWQSAVEGMTLVFIIVTAVVALVGIIIQYRSKSNKNYANTNFDMATDTQ
jgi:hypothetical protein